MLTSVASVEKPISRVSLGDWVGKVHDIRATCDARRSDALQLRHDARRLRNETGSKTKWDNYHNNVKLQDRITEVTRWRDIILDCESDVKKEIADLKQEKELTEAEIEYLNLSFTVVSECLTQRDKRGGSDLCRDPAEEELKRELSVLESLKKMLTDKCQAAWEQTNRLEEIKFQLEQDLSDKTETLNIDHYNLGLDENCANTSYKPQPLRVPKQTLSHDSWLEHCRFLQQRTAHELATSQQLRESMFVPRERARNDLQAQNEATNFALRKRIYETQRIKNELEWQRINMVADMERLVIEMANLDAAYLKKTNALKLCETRCENRLYRPGQELCRDAPMTGLADEVIQLRNTQSNLQEKIDAARSTANALEEQLLVVDRELANKNQALMTDLQCLDLRDRLVTGNRAPPATQTDRNIVLTRIQNEIPDE